MAFHNKTKVGKLSLKKITYNTTKEDNLEIKITSSTCLVYTWVFNSNYVIILYYIHRIET